MKIEEREREFVITITDTERNQLVNLISYRDSSVAGEFRKLLQGMDAGKRTVKMEG